MIRYDFEQSIGYLVCTTSQALQNALNDELRNAGITFRQWQVLACVALLGEPSQGDIADRLGIEGPTLVGVLDRMERDGWIRRHPCPTDRRKKIIRATAGIKDRDYRTAWRVLEQMQENLQGRPAHLVAETNDAFS